MRFEMLGPLRLVTEDGAVNLGSRKRRILLAMLLTRPGRSVGPEILADAMWGSPGLDTARNTLHWHVHQLRKALGDPSRVVMRDGGYTLVVADEEIDAGRFRRLCREGEAALDAGDSETAARLLTEADRLWRGEVFADLLPHPVLHAESARWEELRFAAVEQRCEAELRSGRHDALVPELTALVARYPVRDGLRARLMLALYRSGRQAEALRVFQDGRRYSLDELGLEPGLELVRLERAVLRQDPALDLPRPTVTAVAPVGTPAELPSDLRSFTGRSADLAELTGLLRERSGPVVVAGSGGVGKSTLAIHAAHRVAADFPDGQLYVNLHGATPGVSPLDPVEVLGRFLRSLGCEVPARGGAEELAGRFRTATAHKRILVLLDDAADAAQVRPLLTAGDDCQVLITGRRPLPTLVDIRQCPLDVFTAEEALALLDRRLGRGRVAAEPEAAGELVELCGRFPLALSLAAARLAASPRKPLADQVARLRVEDARLGELAADDQTVRACFEVSYREVAERHPEAAALFRALGLSRGADIDRDAAAALVDRAPAEVEPLLAVLADRMLVADSGTGRHRMHDLLRLYAGELAATAPAEVTDAAVRRLHRHYLATARTAVALLHPQRRWRTEIGPPQAVGIGTAFPEPTAAAQWFDIEADNLMAATRQSAEGDDPATTVGLTASVNARMSMQGRPVRQAELTTIGLAAARRSGADRLLAFAGYDHAETLEFQARPAEALDTMTEALRASRRDDDLALRGRILKSIGYVHKELGDLTAAVDHLEQGLAIHRELGNRMGQAHGLVVLGVVHRTAGRFAEAVAAQREALDIVDELGPDGARAMVRGNLGEAYLAAGRPAAAEEVFTAALDLDVAADMAGTRFEAGHRWGLAQACAGLGRAAEARRHYDAAAELLHRLGAIDDTERDDILAAEEPRIPEILVS